MPDKKNLDSQMFIFLAANSKKFRDKYFNNPAALPEDFNIKKTDLEKIKKIDFTKLTSELLTITSDIANIGPIFDACYDSHASGHTNDCSTAARRVMDPVLARVTRTR